MKAKEWDHSKSDCEKGTVRPAAAPAASPEPEDNWQTFFNALDDLVFVFEPEGRILFTNPATQKQLGYTATELVNLPRLDLYPPEQRPAAAKLLGDLMAGKNTVCLIPLQTKSGACIPVETNILRGQWHGKTVLFGISRHSAEHRLAKEEREHSTSLLQAALDSTTDGILVVDNQERSLLSTSGSHNCGAFPSPFSRPVATNRR